ncbi:MAG: protein phosphatase 2C domain-containing protein [Rhizomicrobium sp.]|nr:protein phosphatase 2C domain-containing protein [Rhizomicrobium sp.]
MQFEILDTLSLPGHAAKQNEDGFAAEAVAVAVLDGATPVAEPLLPGRSDAAWLSQFGARRLLSHIKAGGGARAALRHAMADAEHSFNGLRKRAPKERYELPYASLIFAVPTESGFDALWFGDCSALVERPDATVEVLGSAFDHRGAEAGEALRYSEASGLAPVGALTRAAALPLFQASRAKVNLPGGSYLFGVEPQASEQVARAKITAPEGTLVLLCTDGFLALASDYGLYDSQSLLAAAVGKGLAALGAELRAVEEADAEGRQFPRFKKSDDATAVLARLV